MTSINSNTSVKVISPSVKYTDDFIEADYEYSTSKVKTESNGEVIVST